MTDLKLSLSLALLALTPAQAQYLNFTSSSTPLTAASSPLQNSGLELSASPWFGPQSGTFRGNRVELSGISGSYDAIGAWHHSQNVADNELTVTGSTLNLALTALNQGTSSTSYNTLNISSDSQAQSALAAWSQGTVRVNTLNLEGSATYAVAGMSLNGAAQSNDLWLSSSARTTWAVGGSGASASSNEVITDAGSVATTVLGAVATQGSAALNSVSIMGTANSVVGGMGATAADSNFVDLMGTVNTALAGYSPQGSASYNSITQWSGTTKQLIGAVASGNVLANTVNVSAGSTEQVLGAQSYTGAAYFNQINLYANATVTGSIVGATAHGPANYNAVSIEGTVQGSVLAAHSQSANADLNLLRVTNGMVHGDVTVAQAPSAAYNTLLLNNATINGNAIVAAAQNLAHNLAIVRGTTTVTGTISGTQEVAVDGTIRVGGLTDFRRLHILLHPSNDSVTSANPKHALTVTGATGLDLRHKELWVSGLKVPAADPSKLIYVDATDQLIVDETTLIRGDETFVFNAWVPKDDHRFEHELIWTETGPTPPNEEPQPDEPKPDDPQPDDPQPEEPQPDTPQPDQPSSENPPIFEHSTQVDRAHAQTLLVTPAAAALTLAQGASLLDELVIPKNVAPVIAGRAYDFDFKANGVLELEGAAALMGVALPGPGSLYSVLFMELGQADCTQDFAGITPQGSVKTGGLGVMLGLDHNGWTLHGAMRAGMVQSDFEAYFERTKDQVAFDYDTEYVALSLKGSYELPLTPTISLVPQLRYDLIYLNATDLTIEHKDHNTLNMDAMTLNSVRLGLGAKWQVSDQLALSLSGYGRRILSSRFTGTVENYEVPAYELDGTSCGLNLGAAGILGPVNYHAALRRSWADISEFSGQLELAWPF